jgi:hypothetical protein
MADIRAYLAEQGLTTEEIAAIVGNEKTVKAMSAALAKYDEGLSLASKATTDLEAANAAKVEAEEFWEKKVTPALSGVDRKVATANSEAARYKAYLQSLKDQGYDVPADLLTAPVNPNPNPNPNPTPSGFTREDFNKEMQGTGLTLVTLMSLSNEYQDLYGAPYTAGEQDFVEAQTAKKPFREFVKAKYKFDDKKREKQAAADQARLDKYAAEKVTAAQAEWAKTHGTNPETRAPLASKFDKIEKTREASGKDAWKTNAGREEARKNRLSRFENVTLQ